MFDDSRAAHAVLQDAIKWMNEGLVDIGCPMNYNPDDTQWLASTLDWKRRCEVFETNLFMGISPNSALKQNQDMRTIVPKIHMGRQLGLKGFCMFKFGNLIDSEELRTALAEGPFSKRVKRYIPPPVTPWRQSRKA